MAKKKNPVFTTPAIEVAKVFYEQFEELHEFVTDRSEDVINVKVVHRGGGEWLAIIKRYDADGGIEVLFGGGSDFYNALHRASQGIGAGKWRPDKFLNPPA